MKSPIRPTTICLAALLWAAHAAMALPPVAIAPAPAADPFTPKVAAQSIQGGYAIVISKATQADPDWAQVVHILQLKYGTQARVFVWDKSVDETRDALAAMAPHYTCFIAQQAETGREFVAQVHRLARNLGADPYPATVWGILTGYNAADAQRIASTSAPLVIKSVVSTTGVDNADYGDVFTVSDGAPGKVFRQGAPAQDIPVAPAADGDRVQPVVSALNRMRPDLFVTSSHAGESALEMPWSCGIILARNGTLFGVPTQGGHGAMKLGDHGWAVGSPNPKVWLAAGNCLAGHITDQNSIALAMMHSAGVTQMVGYTVPTWYGAGGWGTLSWFQGQPGRYSLAESFFINDIAITRRLAKEFPGHERFIVNQYDDDIGKLAQPLGITQATPEKAAHDLLGLTWDHDSVAFYGDPAWDARIAPHACPFDQVLRPQGDGWALEVTANQDSPVTAFAFLPRRIDTAQFQATGESNDTLLTPAYVLADLGTLKKGEKKTILIQPKAATPTAAILHSAGTPRS